MPPGVSDVDRIKRSEAETIDVPKCPNQLNLLAYRVKLAQQLANASAIGDDAEIDWIAEVWQPGTTLQSLQRTEKRYISLNRKLASELYKTCLCPILGTVMKDPVVAADGAPDAACCNSHSSLARMSLLLRRLHFCRTSCRSEGNPLREGKRAIIPSSIC